MTFQSREEVKRCFGAHEIVQIGRVWPKRTREIPMTSKSQIIILPSRHPTARRVPARLKEEITACPSIKRRSINSGQAVMFISLRKRKKKRKKTRNKTTNLIKSYRGINRLRILLNTTKNPKRTLSQNILKCEIFLIFNESGSDTSANTKRMSLWCFVQKRILCEKENTFVLS